MKGSTRAEQEPFSPFNAISCSIVNASLEKKREILSFSHWALIILITIAVIYCSIPASAASSGISGFSGKSGSTCTSCHSNGTPPTMTLTGPTTVASGSTNSYTVTVGGSGNHGLDLAVSAGTFTAGTGTKVLNGELTHSAPSTTGSWTFTDRADGHFEHNCNLWGRR
jgi:hypothetical protein